MATPMLELEDVHTKYGSIEALKGISFKVDEGEVVTLIGSNGAGKSTTLRSISGLTPPSTGSIRFRGEEISTLPAQEIVRLGISQSPEGRRCFQRMTVRENLLFAVPPGPRGTREEAVAQALAEMELPQYAHADPATLSGGQRARVALARALLARPRALLLDEPFARLDADLRARMRTLVFDTLAARAIPALLVTHDRADVADATRLTRLSAPPEPKACAH